MNRNWILLGMMGSGKSSIGTALAARTGRDFVDTDVLIEQRFGRRIPEIFRIYTESAFRDHETAILKSLRIENAVVATGGGIVLRDENWVELRRIGITAYLDVDPELLRRRLESSRRKRPLLADEGWSEKLYELCQARQPHYLKADLRLTLGDLDLEGWVAAAQRAFEAAEVESE